MFTFGHLLIWFQSQLSEHEQSLLPQMLLVGECGSNNYIAYNSVDGWFCECCHDPGGLWDWCPSFSDFLRVQLVQLWSGYYGWPDAFVYEFARNITNQWFNDWAQLRSSLAEENED